MRSYYLILLVLSVLFLQVSGIKIKKKGHYKGTLVTDLIECMEDKDLCEYKKKAYEDFRDNTGEYAGVDFVCSKTLQGFCLYNATYSYEYKENVQDNNTPGYIMETDTIIYENKDEPGSKEETADEVGSEKETVDEAGIKEETVDEVGSEKETVDEIGNEKETVDEIGNEKETES